MKNPSKIVFGGSLFLGAGILGVLTVETVVRVLIVCAQWLNFLVN